jgi:DNA modification methylase
MIKPYYQHGGITIYNCDCRSILPELEPVDLVLTDPPYMGLKGGLDITFTSGVGNHHNINQTVGTPWGNDIEILRNYYLLAKYGAFVFCSFHSVPDIPAVINDRGIALITWYQRNAMPSMNNSPHFQTEFIWVFKKAAGLKWKMLKTMYDIARLQSGCMAKERICENGIAVHPTQKPLQLIKELLSVGGTTVLDPFLGSGTTLVACKQLGRKGIGVEISEAYCEIAAKRLGQEVMNFEE